MYCVVDPVNFVENNCAKFAEIPFKKPCTGFAFAERQLKSTIEISLHKGPEDEECTSCV